MRKLIVLLVALGIVSLVVALYPTYVEKPELNAEGPMGIRIDPAYLVPEYHSPLEWWKTHHMDVVNREEITQTDCLYCHEPETSCNNCHNFVGADPIEEQ